MTEGINAETTFKAALNPTHYSPYVKFRSVTQSEIEAAFRPTPAPTILLQKPPPVVPFGASCLGDYPLRSQLKVHLILSGIYVDSSIFSLKRTICREYFTKHRIILHERDQYIEYDDLTSARIYIGFRYDYEAYKVITSKESIELPLVDKEGELGTPKQELSVFFRYMLQAMEHELKEQLKKYGGERNSKNYWAPPHLNVIGYEDYRSIKSLQEKKVKENSNRGDSQKTMLGGKKDEMYYLLGIPLAAKDEVIQAELMKNSMRFCSWIQAGNCLLGSCKIYLIGGDGKNKCNYLKVIQEDTRLAQRIEVLGHPVLVIKAVDKESIDKVLLKYQVRMEIKEKEEVTALKRGVEELGQIVDFNIDYARRSVIVTFVDKNIVKKLLIQKKIVYGNLFGKYLESKCKKPVHAVPVRNYSPNISFNDEYDDNDSLLNSGEESSDVLRHFKNKRPQPKKQHKPIKAFGENSARTATDSHTSQSFQPIWYDSTLQNSYYYH